jgi:hypothetical protein
MRLIKVTGGLGNQMFIYAFYLQMKKRFPSTRIDISDMVHYNVHYGYEMHRVFALPEVEFRINQSLKKVLEFLFFKTILERKQKGSMLPYTKKYVWPLIYFKGFYQSEKYFADIKEEIRNTFTFDLTQVSRQSLQMMDKIAADECAVSLHIRRGDYLSSRHWQAIGSICQLPYYQNAIAEIKNRIEKPSFYVFSDDIAWVKEHIRLDNAEYVDWNKGEDSWQDMMLMSKCRHHIICNSTFSWWGAWLNPRKDKIVIAPSQWTQNADSQSIVPCEWVRIAVN